MHTPEFDFFHHLSWTIGAGQMFHDSRISERTLHRMSPEDRAKAADLVQRYHRPLRLSRRLCRTTTRLLSKEVS